MPKNLTGVPTSFPTQTAPLAGEPRTAGSVETPFQNAADRTTWLRDRLDNIDPTREGVRRLRRFASIPLLQASTDSPDKTLAQVDGVGIYQFDATSTALAASPFVVTPTAVGGGAGRWLWSAFGALNIANGIPQLDGSGLLPTARLAGADGTKVRASSVRNGLVQSLVLQSAGGGTTTSTSEVDIGPGAIATLPSVEPGDILRVSAACAQRNTPSGGLTRAALWVTRPDTVDVSMHPGCVYIVTSDASGNDFPLSFLGSYVATQSGTHQVRLRHAVSVSGTCNSRSVTLFVDVIRP